jgi:hypothetical protein
LTSKIILAVSLLIGAVGPVARADTIAFSTEMEGQKSSKKLFVEDARPNSSLGSFELTDISDTSKLADVPVTPYLPSSEDGQFTSDMSGKISFGNSPAEVVFLEPSIEVENSLYALTNEPYTVRRDDPVSGFIPVDTQVALEPSSLLLLGTGLLGLALITKRARNALQTSDRAPSRGIGSRKSWALAEELKVDLVHIQTEPARQNVYAKSFYAEGRHDRLRDECPGTTSLQTLDDVCQTLELLCCENKDAAADGSRNRLNTEIRESSDMAWALGMQNQERQIGNSYIHPRSE